MCKRHVGVLLFCVCGSELERTLEEEGKIPHQPEGQERLHETHQICHRERELVADGHYKMLLR